MHPFEFIRRERCALCDMAEQMLYELGKVPLETRYVDDDDALETRYGWFVPVMLRNDGEELRWPFDSVKLRRFLEE